MSNFLFKFSAALAVRVFLGLAAISLLSFLYAKTQSFDQQQHNRIVANLSQFKQLDATLNQDVIESRSHLLNNYDPIVRSLSRLHAVTNGFVAGPSSIYHRGQADIDAQIDALNNTLIEKESFVERFKSHNAILNNSLKYFPVVTDELIKLVMASKGGDDLTLLLGKLLTDVLIYNLTASPELKQQISRSLDSLSAKRDSASPEVLSSLDILISHARTILVNKGEVDDLVAGIIHTPSAQASDKLIQAYQAYVNQSMRRVNIYRFYLYLFSITLLAYIIHILFKLRHTADELADDIMERKQAEAALFREKERAQVTLESIGDAVITTDTAGHVEYLNPVAESLTGWTGSEAHGLPLQQVFHVLNELTRETVANPVESVIQEGKTINPSGHAMLVQKNGGEFSIEKSAAPIRDRDGAIVGVVLVFRDVSHSRKMAAQLQHQASHDALTGLINRREFERRLARTLASLEKLHTEHALLYLDLDQFKIVNDTCGHIAGDELLRQITNLLQIRLRERDTLARLGGDEFGVLLEHCPPEQAARIADELRQTVKDFYFVWQEKAFTMGVSIGLVSYYDATLSLAEILSAADTACYIAKDKGRNRVHAYHPEDSDLALRHVEMEWVGRIHKAFEENRFQLYSQEIISLHSSNGTPGAHAELLIRMLDEEENLVPPMAFIPAAERYNLMPAIDRWVVRTAFAHYSRLYTAHEPGAEQMNTRWTINLSGTSLSDEHFLQFVQEQFLLFGVPYQAICFEITETAAISNLGKAVHFIQELRKLGCSFSLDDFGIGLSSFAYLKHLPVDYLKIDGSFIKNMAHDPIDRAMVEAINNIGHVMGIQTIAEFVENKETLAMLKQIGVDHAQGYGIAKPQPFDVITHYQLVSEAS
jgi:diguanylate cyclase (GGDEF)-like protein/PAS domain S-box-containing protein